ncbi:pyroglutamyl-peptidase I [Bdellovibrio sp.]|uniref:pyroglutamyl-peptidase I family protein n=1 Tax=Bdellovibrio sp. TaxID=28201 RepID=UPI0039E64B02
MIKSSRILVTGFRPFQGESINPSEILLEWIKKDFSVKHGVDTLLLPVSFNQGPLVLLEQLSIKSYDVILLLGQAGGRSKVSLERVALNWIETEKPDEDQHTPQQGVIEEGVEPALFSHLPLSEWKEQIVKMNLPLEVSLSAGGYVCNYVYFQALRHIQKNQLSSKACFIHVPYLPEQVVDKGNAPSLDLETMKNILRLILEQCFAPKEERSF